MCDQLQLFSPADESMIRVKAYKDACDLIRSGMQPSARELISQLQNKHGWRVRYLFRDIIREVEYKEKLSRALVEYIRTVLSDDEINMVFRAGTKPTSQEQSTIDELFRDSLIYRSSKAYQEALQFSATFRDYSPYNNMLVRVQDATCSYYATARDWRNRFKRKLKEDARPMLILAPMHPVMLVFSLDETTGDDLPEHLLNFSKAEGEFKAEWLERTIQNAERLGIEVQRKKLSSTNAGFATTRLEAKAKYKMRIVIHKELSDIQTFVVLCHEIGHILLGHLGTDHDHWWPCRMELSHSVVETEAESVSYMVAHRLGLKTSADNYLAAHLSNGVPERISLDLIVKVASRIEDMTGRMLPPKKRKRIKLNT